MVAKDFEMTRVLMTISVWLMVAGCVLYGESIKIMPLGDSITYDDSYADYPNARPASVRHAYRNYLWYLLRGANFDVDFVGSRVAGSAVVPPFDPDNEGYPGETTDFIASIVYNRLVRYKPDIVLLHIGTNDRWRIDSSGSYMGGIRRILSEVNRFRQQYQYPVHLVIAQIIGRRYNDYSGFTNTFNANLAAIVYDHIEQGEPITLIDMQHDAGLNYYTDFRDPAHPTNAGYAKMANLWFRAIKPLLSQPTKGYEWLPAIYHNILF